MRMNGLEELMDGYLMHMGKAKQSLLLRLFQDDSCPYPRFDKNG